VLVPVARLLRVASIVICVIVGVSFLLFAVNKTSGASAHQQAVLNGEVSAAPETAPGSGQTATAASSKPSSTSHEGSLRRSLDEASSELTSPFAGLVSDSHSEWTERLFKLLLALAVYGFGLGFLARVVRVRL
jgi:urease accessory protein UreF